MNGSCILEFCIQVVGAIEQTKFSDDKKLGRCRFCTCYAVGSNRVGLVVSKVRKKTYRSSIQLGGSRIWGSGRRPVISERRASESSTNYYWEIKSLI